MLTNLDDTRKIGLSIRILLHPSDWRFTAGSSRLVFRSYEVQILFIYLSLDIHPSTNETREMFKEIDFKNDF